MKKIRFKYIVVILLVIFISCSKDKQTLTENTWLVHGVKLHADSNWDILFDMTTASWGLTTLSFVNENKYVLQSGPDCIIGGVKIEKKRIQFEYPFMKPISRSAKICQSLLPECKYYEIDGDMLNLTGDKGEAITLGKNNNLKKSLWEELDKIDENYY